MTGKTRNMLDLFTIFSKGGIVLWYFQGTSESFTSSVNALIKSVILQVTVSENFAAVCCVFKEGVWCVEVLDIAQESRSFHLRSTQQRSRRLCYKDIDLASHLDPLSVDSIFMPCVKSGRPHGVMYVSSWVGLG